jgi:hypothetical protein
VPISISREFVRFFAGRLRFPVLPGHREIEARQDWEAQSTGEEAEELTAD